jgi:hypothetical protein
MNAEGGSLEISCEDADLVGRIRAVVLETASACGK